MTTVRGLTARITHLERSRTRRLTPIEAAYGSHEAFEELTRDQIERGELAREDMEAVLDALQRWHVDSAWSNWKRPTRQMWEFAG